MVATIQIENYRAFASAARVQVRALNLVFGYNSAGKSALLRFLPLLKDSIAQREQALSMLSQSMRGASFADLLSKHGSSPSLRFAVNTGVAQIEYVIRSIPETRAQVVESFTLEVEGHASTLTWAADAASPNTYHLKGPDEDRLVDVVFTGLFISPTIDSDSTAIGMSIFAERQLQQVFKNVWWLQALRAVPPRKEVVSDPVGYISPDGSGITQLLYHAEKNGSDVLDAVSNWYERATGRKLVVERGAFSSRELISYRLENTGQHIELADTGEGIGQVLPIVGLLYLALRGLLGDSPILVLEHPELHLHAAVEPALAELICEVAASGRASVVAETHSDSFLLALQLALIERRLKPEDVGAYWVRQGESGPAVIEEITFDAFGLPNDQAWPTAIFSEKTKQARNVVLARRTLTNES